MFFEHKGVDVNFESDKAASVSVYRLFGEDHDASAWPRRTGVLCWHCCHPFDTIPVSFATSIRRREKGVEWTMKGVYCSVECCRRHLCDTAAYNTPTLLMRLYDFAEKVLGIDRPEDTQVAPPREALRAFGGPMTIEEFRQSFRTPQMCGLLSYPFVSYPMLMSMGGSGSSGAMLADALGHDSSSSIRRLTRPSAPSTQAKDKGAPRATSSPVSAGADPPEPAKVPIPTPQISEEATETEEADKKSVYDMYIKRRSSGSGPSLAEDLPAPTPPGRKKPARKASTKTSTSTKRTRPKKPRPKKQPKPKKQPRPKKQPSSGRRASNADPKAAVAEKPKKPKKPSRPRSARIPARPHRPPTGTVKCRVLRSSVRSKDSDSEPATRTLGKRRSGSGKGGPNTLMCYVISEDPKS